MHAPRGVRKRVSTRRGQSARKEKLVYVNPVSRGRVYCASMDLRGASCPVPRGAVRINLSTAQQKTSPPRVAFSPMHARRYNGFACFHNWQQSFLRYEGFEKPHQRERLRKWWLGQPQPRAACPFTLHRTLKGAWSTDGQPIDLPTARKELFIPRYIALVVAQPLLMQLRRRVQMGVSVALYDYKAPRGPHQSVAVREFDAQQWTKALQAPETEFGHVYLVAALLTDIL